MICGQVYVQGSVQTLILGVQKTIKNCYKLNKYNKLQV